MGDFEKKFPASACRKKKIACSTNVIESLREKKGKKNILPTRLREKKILDDQKSPTHYPPRPQELNGRSLSKVASYFRRNVLFIRKGPRLIFPCIFHFRIELYPSGIGEPSCPVSFPSLPHKTNFHHGRNWIFFHIKKCL